MPALHNTREDWLTAYMEAARPLWAARGVPIPDNVRIGLGFAYGTRKAIGQCWGSAASKDGAFEIFISPVHTSGLKAADTLCHELAHAVDGCKNGHKKPFVDICHKVGLLKGGGKNAHGEGCPEWHEWSDAILAALGPFPHAAMDVTLPTKQGTRLLKAECESCGFVFRVTAKWAGGCDLQCPDRDCGGFVSLEC